MDTLVRRAKAVRGRAYCPYSGYWVGASLETIGGEVFVGCNAEVASFSETDHAERAAISMAIAGGAIERHGQRFIRRLAVVHEQGTPPCGGCRQRLQEHAAPEMEIVTATPNGQITGRYSMTDLLPSAFTLEKPC